MVGSLGAAVIRVQVLDQAGAGGAQRDGPAVGGAVGVAGIGEHVAERDAVPGHLRQHRDQGAGRVQVAGCQGHPAGQLGDGRRVFFPHHRGGGEVVPEEQLAVLAGAAALAVSPGRLGAGAVPAAPRRRAGEGFLVAPVGGQRAGGVLVRVGDAGSGQVAADAGERRAGGAVGGVFFQCPDGEPEGALGLAVGEQVRAVLPAGDHAEPDLVARRAGWSGPGGRGSGAQAGDRPGLAPCPAAGCGPAADGGARRPAAGPRSAPRPGPGR